MRGKFRAVAWGLAAFGLCLATATIVASDIRQAPDSRPLIAQEATCAVTWVGREAEFEAYLRTAEFTRMEDVPVGVTKPRRGFFEPPGPIVSFAWKLLPPGLKSGYWESYKAEIAAYELDKLLGMDMVPPTAERRIDGDLGAVQQWVEPVTGWRIDEPVRGPEPEWSKRVNRMKLFDLLSGNIDRNQGNLLYDGDYHLILIDHSRAFTDKKDLKNIAATSRVDAWLWSKIEALTREQLQAALGPWLREKEINAILARRDKMREAIGQLVADRGEAAVFIR